MVDEKMYICPQIEDCIYKRSCRHAKPHIENNCCNEKRLSNCDNTCIPVGTEENEIKIAEGTETLKCPSCGRFGCWTTIPEDREWVKCKCGEEVHLHLYGIPVSTGGEKCEKIITKGNGKYCSDSFTKPEGACPYLDETNVSWYGFNCNKYGKKLQSMENDNREHAIRCPECKSYPKPKIKTEGTGKPPEAKPALRERKEQDERRGYCRIICDPNSDNLGCECETYGKLEIVNKQLKQHFADRLIGELEKEIKKVISQDFEMKYSRKTDVYNEAIDNAISRVKKLV